MPDRRSVLRGLAAAALVARPSWAQAGSPAYLSAAKTPAGDHMLCGLDATGDVLFRLPIPGRGHAAAAHPERPEAVGFARRPGRFAVVVECAKGAQIARLDAPQGRHFYGHGVFSRDGTRLYTTENDYDAARGVIGVWDARTYRRLGEFDSGGTGPHDLRLMPDGETLVVANGGIETHPDSGRAKLNLPMMAPSLAYLSMDGTLLEQVAPPRALHRNSIRHMDVRADGLVVAACQWEGDATQTPPLFLTHRRGDAVQVHGQGQPAERRMLGYVGSAAFSGDGAQIALTGPRGGLALVYSDTGALQQVIEEPDVGGVAAHDAGLMLTAGTGAVRGPWGTRVAEGLAWDNHLVRI